MDGYEDTDSGETLTVGSQIPIKDSVVNGESAIDQVASGGGKCNRYDVTIDSGDNGSHHGPEMTSQTQPVPRIVQVSLYGINRYMYVYQIHHINHQIIIYYEFLYLSSFMQTDGDSPAVNEKPRYYHIAHEVLTSERT